MTYEELIQTLEEQADSGYYISESALNCIHHLMERNDKLFKCLDAALLWTEPEYDVGPWREKAETLLEEKMKNDF